MSAETLVNAHDKQSQLKQQLGRALEKTGG